MECSIFTKMKIMKKIMLLILPLAFLLQACPVEVGYAPGNPGKEKLNEKILGSWTSSDSGLVFTAVNVVKADDFSADVKVLQKSADYMIEDTEFKLWTTVIDGKNFAYLCAKSKLLAPTYYLYHFIIDKNTMKLYEVRFLVEGIDGITSTESFREEVSASMKNPECFVSAGSYVKP